MKLTPTIISCEAPMEDSRFIFKIIPIDHMHEPFELRIDTTKHVRDIMVRNDKYCIRIQCLVP